MTKKPGPTYDARLERTLAWTAAVFAAVAVSGLAVEPALRVLWIVVLVFACAAVGTIIGGRVRPASAPARSRRRR